MQSIGLKQFELLYWYLIWRGIHVTGQLTVPFTELQVPVCWPSVHHCTDVTPEMLR